MTQLYIDAACLATNIYLDFFIFYLYLIFINDAFHELYSITLHSTSRLYDVKN